ncbi:hypothetical protein [Neorhodopirellula pilleata]|uniref:Uncharacterized protein n=1 Tax=Neorhodopirellula pilleata TaxID=2714738 RepID=A0A5C6A1N7_9BACT|nr:hypothetical protein [Neorhodopirellula pilleata]TWT93489.1 hypothetical protein Pla100_40060 [Neorhodopirellula pilleata]
MRRIRFGLKTLLVLIALLAVYLAWRTHDPEARALSAIKEAGGKTYYGYQQPWMGSTKSISVGQLPGYEYYSQHDISCVGTQTQPKLTLAEILFGKTKERRATAVELPIGKITPELETALHSLTELQSLVIEMPAMMASSESVEVERLGELQDEFGDKVWPTVKLGL